MRYKKGYKYQLVQEFILSNPPTGRDKTDLYVGAFIFHSDKRLRIFPGYAWDGPSGPVRDRRKLMRASLVHDALYQLIREGYLPASARDKADRLFQAMCVDDGVSRPVAWAYYKALRVFGRRAATKPREVYEV